MAKLTTNEVKTIARLANLPLTKKEETGFSSQLSKIVDYFDELRAVNTKGVDPTFVPVDLENITRKDATKPCLTQEEALKNSPAVDNGMFVVSKITSNHLNNEQ
ncbi:MAG: Asp-tRNA(Asn)/Glu-tRNA(Gln) amidotransferase subunit GatC [Patescibacteria group bacterium]